MKVKVLNVKAEDQCNCYEPCDGTRHQYEYEAFELPTGEAVVHYHDSGSELWDTPDDIQACGLAQVIEVTETGETVTWSKKWLREIVEGSIRSYGVEAIPESLLSVIPQRVRESL